MGALVPMLTEVIVIQDLPYAREVLRGDGPHPRRVVTHTLSHRNTIPASLMDDRFDTLHEVFCRAQYTEIATGEYDAACGNLRTSRQLPYQDSGDLGGLPAP